MRRGAPTDPVRHLCLVFFDALACDGTSLLNQSLETRRRVLEEAVVEIPGFVSTVEGAYPDRQSKFAEAVAIPLDSRRRAKEASRCKIVDGAHATGSAFNL